MTQDTQATKIKKQLEQIDQRYAANFAGHARATRSLDLLDDLIASCQDLAGQLRSAKGESAERDEVVAQSERQLELYRSERTLIDQAKRQGPQATEAGKLGSRANQVFHVYARHFAGQSRTSRDGTLLGDMLDELKTIRAAMAALVAQRPDLEGARSDLAVIDGRIDQFTKERQEVAKAQSDGAPDDQASALGGTANNLFAQYTRCFANQPRVSRRPELLVRLTGALQTVRDKMVALKKQGLADASNDQNLGIVESRLVAWQSELTAIRAERQKASAASLESDLATAANAEFESYGEHFAGKTRATRDLDRLCGIIDRLSEVERQMQRLDDVHGRPANTQNLQIVRNNLGMYTAEYDEIVKARAH